MENKNALNEENLESVNGGKLEKLRAEINSQLSDAVREKLQKVYSDVEYCKILAENGVDLAEIEKKIADAGLDMKRIGLQLPDDNLSEIAGGFYDSDQGSDIVCSCGNSNRDDFSRQFWASLAFSGKSIYRCKKCNMYIAVYGKGKTIIHVRDIDDLNRFED